MNKKIIIYLLFVLLFSLCSCSDNNIEQCKECDLEIFEYDQALTCGTFNISKNYSINHVQVFFIINEYQFLYFPGYDNVEIIELKGENCNALNVKIIDCYSCSEYNEKQLICLCLSVSTSSDDDVDVKIDSIKIKVNDLDCNIVTNLKFYIRNQFEYIQAKEGTLLFQSKEDLYSNGIRKYPWYFEMEKMLVGDYLIFEFNDSSMFLRNKDDYLVIDRIYFDVNDFTEKVTGKFTLDPEGSKNYQVYEIKDEQLDLKVNKNEYYHWIINMNIDYSVTFKTPGVYYIALSIDYHFSYDDTVKTICLASGWFDDRAQILESIYK